jgi:hypothetical protein
MMLALFSLAVVAAVIAQAVNLGRKINMERK